MFLYSKFSRSRSDRYYLSHECFVERSVCRPPASWREGWEGREEPEIEVRIGNAATWQRRALDRAQCRFKMAAVRDRYRAIFVENVRICDASCHGLARAEPWDPGACAPHPAPSPSPLNVRISKPYCADTVLPT